MNNRWRYLNSGPQLLLTMFIIASMNFVFFFITWSRYTLYFNLLSRIISRYFISITNCIIVSFISIDVFMFYLCLMKWMSIYFDYSNCASCLFLHFSAWLSILISFFVFSRAVFSLVSYAISSMNSRSSSDRIEMSSKSML